MLSSRGSLRLSIVQVGAPAPRDVSGSASLGTSPGDASHPAWPHPTPRWGSDGTGPGPPRDGGSDVPRAQDGWPGGDENSWGRGTVSPCSVPNPHVANPSWGAPVAWGGVTASIPAQDVGIPPYRPC